MNKRRSFFSRIWLGFVLFSLIIFAMLWLLQNVFLKSFYDVMLINNTRKVTEEIVSSGKSDTLLSTIDSLSADNSLLIFITDENGNIIYSSDSYKSFYHSYIKEEIENPYHENETLSYQSASYRNLPDDYAAFLNELKSTENGKIELKDENHYICGSFIELQDSQAVLYVSCSLGTINATASIIRIQLLAVMFISLILSFVLAWVLALKFSYPLKQLSSMAKQLSKEEVSDLIIKKSFCRELDELTDSMNESAVKLKEARKYQKEFLGNISHDIRTPLTMIKGYAVMIRDVSWNDEKLRNKDADIIIREADRLNNLVNEIIEYSSLSLEEYKKEFKIFDLSEMTANLIEEFEELYLKENIIIEKDIEKDCLVYGDRKLLYRTFYNLIDNALHHTGEKRKIKVSLLKEDQIIFEVRDYGEGIDEEKLNHIFERYFTARQRNNNEIGGLGLAICKETVDIHKGQIGVQSKKNEGSLFWIKLDKQ
ncbi:MAG: sensor histidine kinase [Erysipelotrichaceae bacterium]